MPPLSFFGGPSADLPATRLASGNVPVYTANGVQCYAITLVTLVLGTYFGWFNPARVYVKFGEMLSSLNVFALLFCFFLMIKGRYFPSTSDNGLNKTLIQDFYWGTELYPRILGWDVKTFTNCRFGLMCVTRGSAPVLQHPLSWPCACEYCFQWY